MNAVKLLIVDPELEVIDLFGTFFGNAGYDVKTTNSPFTALTLADSFSPNVVLTEVVFGGSRTGYQLCKELVKKLPQTVVLFITNLNRGDDCGESFKSGGDMYIKKPVSLDRLLEIVNIVVLSSVNPKPSPGVQP